MEIQSWITLKREALRTLGPLATRDVTPSIRDFHHSVTTSRSALSVVAEIARATPEEGVLREDLDVLKLAEALERAGVSAIAVAIDSVVCRGSGADLRKTAAAVGTPVLARDLFLTKDQIYQARLLGADAVLLTTAALPAAELRALMEISASLHMAAPLEVRSQGELALAANLGARLVVLPAFAQGTLSLQLPDQLLPRVPRSITPLVRGPFRTPEDFEPLRGRADGIWIAGPILQATDPAGLVAPLVEAAEGG